MAESSTPAYSSGSPSVYASLGLASSSSRRARPSREATDAAAHTDRPPTPPSGGILRSTSLGSILPRPSALPAPSPETVRDRQISFDTALGSSDEELPAGVPQPRRPKEGKGPSRFQALGSKVTMLGRVVNRWEKVKMPFGEIQMTRLMKACAKGDLETVVEELRELAEVPERLRSELLVGDEWAGSSPLHWAAYSGVADCVRAVLAANADARARNTRDRSMPIHLAARYGVADVLAALVDFAPDTLLAQNALGNTPLHESAVENRVEGVRLFLMKARELETAGALAPAPVEAPETASSEAPGGAAAALGSAPATNAPSSYPAAPSAAADLSARPDGASPPADAPPAPIRITLSGLLEMRTSPAKGGCAPQLAPSSATVHTATLPTALLNAR